MLENYFYLRFLNTNFIDKIEIFFCEFDPAASYFDTKLNFFLAFVLVSIGIQTESQKK